MFCWLAFIFLFGEFMTSKIKGHKRKKSLKSYHGDQTQRL
ncbi:hypothetical protein KIS4809_1013 [Bacillus sp. ZZV12-4809]|nr:hypothetical protein KIS4809_1013 [Bacillus sp. ZZV12-4809]